ncbi:MAG: exodeoxyribonuclease V subunit alpha [Pseudomonadales bacterium]
MPQLEDRLLAGEINYLDYYFCRFIAELEANRLHDSLTHLIADLSHALTEQHSCLDLSQRGDAENLITRLKETQCVGDGTEPTPLVLEGSKLYLHRYYSYESRIAASLVARNRPLEVDASQFERAIRTSFPNNDQPVDWQQVATLQALTRQLSIITGGPGTGKTSTVVKILAILLENQDITVKLAAPTGKAAMRLNESINGALPELPKSIASRIPDQVQTIHRLLGMRTDGRSARYNENHRLPVEFLVVDEVSMIDLPLMDRLLRAIPDHTRLLLIGDPDQLPSVEVGNILADICRYPAGFSESYRKLTREILNIELPAGPANHLLTDTISQLKTNYRFSTNKGIGLIAESIREGIGDLPADDDEMFIHNLAELDQDPGKQLALAYADYLEHLRQASTTPTALIASFDRSRILSPVREGSLGVARLNQQIEAHLRATGWVADTHEFYHGRPVIITRNDYTLGLFNGDTGITVLDPADNQLKVAFKGIDGELKLYLASRLPPHETCFAMTIHKSQGSEFDHVTLILPDNLPEKSERVMTRELLYTAVTRARSSISVYLNRATWQRTLTKTIGRNSGLGERFLSDTSQHHAQ